MANWNESESEFVARLVRSRQRRNRQRRVSGATLVAWMLMLMGLAVLLMAVAGR